jgi:hypothetical protein
MAVMIRIPGDAKVTIGTQPMGWTVCIARAGAQSDILKTMQQPGMSAVLTHDPGMTWTDKKGERLANALLAQPATAVFMVFEFLADALACKKRLEVGNA